MSDLKDVKIHYTLYNVLDRLPIVGCNTVDRKVEMLLYIWIDEYLKRENSGYGYDNMCLTMYEMCGKYLRAEDRGDNET